MSNEDMKIFTFEEKLLSEEEREDLRKRKEEDLALAAYYREAFNNPDSFVTIEEEPLEDFLEDDAYIKNDEL